VALFLDHMVQIWDPMLGLIIDVQAPWATFPAAALLWVWVLRFVYLVFPIRLYNDHKYSSPPSMKTSQDKWLLLGAWDSSYSWKNYCTNMTNSSGPWGCDTFWPSLHCFIVPCDVWQRVFALHPPYISLVVWPSDLSIFWLEGKYVFLK